MFERLSSVAGAGELPELDGPGTVWVFKHSLTCPISAHALREVRAFMDRNPSARVLLVEIQRERRASNAIAGRLGVRHASPQFIQVTDGDAVWWASHLGITVGAIEAAAAQPARDSGGAAAGTGPSYSSAVR